jgi:transposase
MAISLQSSLENILILVLQSADVKKDRRLFLMDNDQSQASKAARKAMEKIDGEFHKIPPRSPDLKPIENVFHLVKKSLENEAIANNITYETFQDFSAWVLKSLEYLSTDVIDLILFQA